MRPFRGFPPSITRTCGAVATDMPRQHSRGSERVRATTGLQRSRVRVPGDHPRECDRDAKPTTRASKNAARGERELLGVLEPPRGADGPRHSKGDPTGVWRRARRCRETIEHVRVGRCVAHAPMRHSDPHRPRSAVRRAFRQVLLHERGAASGQLRPLRGRWNQPACGVRGGDVPALLNARRSVDRELEHVERPDRRWQARGAATVDRESV